MSELFLIFTFSWHSASEVAVVALRRGTRFNRRMSVLAELLDRAHFAWVCRRAARRLECRLAEGGTALAQRSGTLVAEDLLVAPLSGARVAGYRVLVEIPARHWMNRRVVVDHGVLAPCLLRSAAGLHRVASGRSLVVVAEPCQRGARAAGSADEPHGFPAEVAALLAERAQLPAEAVDPHRYLWAEYHVHDGDHVLIDGVRLEGEAARVARGQTGGEGDGEMNSEMDGEMDSEIDVLGADAERPLLVSTIAKGALLEMLRDPDEAVMRRLPAMLRTDRTLDE